MAITASTMVELGTRMPDFSLPDPRGGTYGRADFEGRQGCVVVFMCNHCPAVKHLASALGAFAKWCESVNVSFVGINANDAATYPADAPEKMIEEAQKNDWTFPYLHDETQNVARAFGAACTPDFFLFDKTGRLAYRGQFDASRPGNKERVSGVDLRNAVQALLNGSYPPDTQYPSSGCNIKWR